MTNLTMLSHIEPTNIACKLDKTSTDYTQQNNWVHFIYKKYAR